MMELFAAACAALAMYFFIRYRMLCRSIREAKKELSEIERELSENRVIKLSVPNQELESLLEAVNDTLERIRRERILYQQREEAFQRQIENISHDLRTPLTSVIGYLEIIREEDLGEEDREALKVVRRKALFLKELIADFYELSRLNAGDYPLEAERVDFSRAVKEQVADAYQELCKAGIAVKLRMPESPLFVRADGKEVGRILSNLLSNAACYAGESLLIEVKQEEKTIRAEFQNSVEGMDEEDVKRLFERFYRFDPARGGKGTGLGLTIARELAEQMGGELSVSLLGGKNLCFVLRLKKD